MRSLPRVLLIDLDDTIVRYGAGGEGLWAEVIERFAARLPVAPSACSRRSTPCASPSGPTRAEPRSRARTCSPRAARSWRKPSTRLGLSPEGELVREVADAYSSERRRASRRSPVPSRRWPSCAAAATCSASSPTAGRRSSARRSSATTSRASSTAVRIEGEVGVGKPEAAAFAGALAALGARGRGGRDDRRRPRRGHRGRAPAGLATVWVDHAGAGPPPGRQARPRGAGPCRGAGLGIASASESESDSDSGPRPMSEPKQPRSERTQERLLRAAEKLILEKGLADASVPEIARRAGSSVGGFYARFPDKDALLRALEERFFARDARARGEAGRRGALGGRLDRDDRARLRGRAGERVPRAPEPDRRLHAPRHERSRDAGRRAPLPRRHRGEDRGAAAAPRRGAAPSRSAPRHRPRRAVRLRADAPAGRGGRRARGRPRARRPRAPGRDRTQLPRLHRRAPRQRRSP